MAKINRRITDKTRKIVLHTTLQSRNECPSHFRCNISAANILHAEEAKLWLMSQRSLKLFLGKLPYCVQNTEGGVTYHALEPYQVPLALSLANNRGSYCQCGSIDDATRLSNI